MVWLVWFVRFDGFVDGGGAVGVVGGGGVGGGGVGVGVGGGCWLVVVGCWLLVGGCWLLPPRTPLVTERHRRGPSRTNAVVVDVVVVVDVDF